MRRVYALALYCILSLLACLQVDCALFRGACSKALPTVTAAQSYAADAAEALQQAQIVINRLPLSDEARAKATALVDKAHEALRAVQAALATASDACSSPRVLDLFVDFANVWNAIEILIAQHSPHTDHLGLAPVQVRPPEVVLALRRAQVHQ